MMYSVAPASSARHDLLLGVLGRAEDHLRLVAARHLAELGQELEAAHDRHVPVEQDQLGERLLAVLERLSAVLGLGDLEVHAFEDLLGDLADERAVIHDQRLSSCYSPYSTGTHVLVVMV